MNGGRLGRVICSRISVIVKYFPAVQLCDSALPAWERDGKCQGSGISSPPPSNQIHSSTCAY